MTTFRLTTLGCRVNHAETREIETVLRSRGLRPAAPRAIADLEVIHTCSVTNAAAAKSRQAVRRAIRRNRSGIHRLEGGCDHDETPPVPPPADPRDETPGPESDPLAGKRRERAPENAIFVAGCYAATNTEEAITLAGSPARVVPHEAEDGSSMIDRFADRLDEWLARLPSHRSIRTPAAGSSIRRPPSLRSLPVIAPEEPIGRHVRAELRIQDGCDAHCTFCIIPRIRRTLRSKTIDDAVREAERLVDLGHREIVLTGIFIGAYGQATALRRRQDRAGRDGLADLLDAVARVPGVQRLRISSMEPGDVTGPLLDAMVANAPVVVPHLHLPLQSGSDRILRRMNRQYDVADYLEMIEQVNSALTTPDGLPPAITTDVICGFPGETDADFAETERVAERVGYLHMHVFPFSPKRGTAAARWTDLFVADAVKKARVRRLIALETGVVSPGGSRPSAGLALRYRRRLSGRETRVILEQPARDRPGFMTGRCDHYVLVHVATRRPRGECVTVQITDVDETNTTGRIVAAPIALPILPS